VKHARPHAISSAPRLVAWLVVLGLGAGAATHAAMFWVWRWMRQSQLELVGQHDAMATLSREVNRRGKTERLEVMRLLDGESVEGSDGSNPPVSIAGYDPELAGVLAGLNSAMKRSAELKARSRSWLARHLESESAVEAARARVQSSMEALRAGVNEADGRQRLRIAAMLRERRAEGMKARADDELALVLARAPDTSGLLTELADIGVWCRQLELESKSDNLGDLTDNRIAPGLSRIRRSVRRLSSIPEFAGLVTVAQVDELEEAVFGSNWRSERPGESIVPGGGGWYGALAERRELARERTALRLELSRSAGLLDESTAALGSAISLITQGHTQRADRVYSTTGALLITGSCIVAGAFAMTAWRIVRSVRRQVVEIEQANAALDRAMHAARAADAAKSQFLANMSHEIRTPMAAIIGYADLLRDPGQPAESRAEFAATIRRNGEHLLAIINDILDLSKVEAGQLCVERVAVSPVQLIEDVRSLMSVRAHEKGITLAVAYRFPLPSSIRTDPLRLRQILVNLVGNAIKFTNEGGVTITVGLDGADTSEPRLRLDVQDTGIGIPAEQAGRLFRPFVQGDDTMSRRFGGTGLGLTIARRLAGLLGGDITLRSEPGKGSTFTATIATGPLDAAGMVDRLPGGIGDMRSPFGAVEGVPQQLRARVLLAEDGEDNQRLICHHLRRAGVEVSVACDGREAVRLAAEAQGSEAPFDLVLMDMQMPELDGYAATRLLRQRGFRGPIVALTAHAMEGDRERCLEAGCDSYAAKPIARDDLLRIVHRWTGGARRSAA
jgi:signal transduction histidine kinase/ActR/RegA family two-component response regulator